MMNRLATKTYRRNEWLAFWVLLVASQTTFGQTPSLVRLGTLGGSSSTAYGVNALGQVVGSSQLEGDAEEHAFLFSSNIVDLGTLGGPFSVGYAINKGGQVVGYSWEPGSPQEKAFLFSNNTMLSLGTLGGSSSYALDINEAGQIVGNSRNQEEAAHAFIYRNGQMLDLGTLGGGYAAAKTLNSNGWVVGESTLPDQSTHAFLWKNGTMLDLGTLGGGSYSTASDINDAGWAAGYSYTANWESHAFLYDGTSLRDLGTLGGGMSMAYKINNKGQVAGDSYAADGANHSFFYAGGQMTDLGTLGGGYSTVYDLNNSGLVVGESDSKAFLWENGTMTDLNTLIPADSGWVLMTAYNISDGGYILGYGLFHGASDYFLLSLNRPSNQSPVAEAGPDQVVECAGAQTTVVLNGTGSTDPDNDALSYTWLYNGAVVSTNAVTSMLFTLGTYPMTLRVTDPSGVSSEDSMAVTVVDTTAPAIQCPAPLVLPANNTCQAIIPDLLANLPVADVGTAPAALVKLQAPPAGTVVGLGQYTIQITVTDASGNQSACATTVTVLDKTAPAVQCPAPLVLPANSACQAIIPDLLANLVATDGCTAPEALVKVQTPPAGTVVGLGQYAIQITVTDASGNQSVCATTVTVLDKTAPVIQALGVTPTDLGSPNHKMIPVTVLATVRDNCDPAPVTRIVSITSSEPETSLGDKTSPDWEITGALTANLRAEVGKTDGGNRVYTLLIESVDASGNTSTGVVYVTASSGGN